MDLDKIKKVCMVIVILAVLVLIIFSVVICGAFIDELVNFETSEFMNWFPDDSEIAGWFLGCSLIVGLSGLSSILLFLLEIKLTKKLKSWYVTPKPKNK